MNNKGTRSTNGEGCIYNTIAKQKRKKILSKECSICEKCTDRTACNNRIGYDKCVKCEECKIECLSYCDRFYCYERNQVQITIDGKQTTVANEKKRKDAIKKKKEAEAKAQTKTYVKKNGITLSQKIQKILDKKLSANEITENTYIRELHDLNHIKNSNIGDKPMQKLTPDEIQNFINTKIYLSQDSISKIMSLIFAAFTTAVLDKEINYADNPMQKIKIPISIKNNKEVMPFELDEQIALIKYITTNTIITSCKNTYDNRTMRNLILLALLTGMRIGELGALDINKHIDLKNKHFKVERTLTKDKNNKIIIGSSTKTGRKKRKQNKSDFRIIPFDIFDKDIVASILKEQIAISNSIINNTDNLLFCKKDGNYISHSQVTNIFKRICRQAGIKLDLPERMPYPHDKTYICN